MMGTRFSSRASSSASSRLMGRRRWSGVIVLVVISLALAAGAGSPAGGNVAHAFSLLSSGWFTVTVEADTGSMPPTTEDDGTIVTVVPEIGTAAEWRFIYRVENISTSETMTISLVTDAYGPELDVWGIGHRYSDEGIRPGAPTIVKGIETDSFVYTNFVLQPGQWAQLTVMVRTREDQHHPACGLYTMTSGATLRATLSSGAAILETGPPVLADVLCPSYMEITMNTKMSWFLRMPGDYYALAVDGTVHASYPVAITFSEFGDVTSATNGQSLPVFYALNEERPQGWLTPAQLNATSLLVPTDDSAVKWNMWQRVVLDGQSAGTYTDKGVITFTLQNVRDALN